MTENADRARYRVAIVVSSDRRRGAEVFGEALSGGMVAAGWEAELLALTSSGSGPRVAATPLSAVPPDGLGKLDAAVVRSLRRRVQRDAPDVVLANGAATMQYAVAALRLMRHRPRLVYVSIGEPMYWIRNDRHRLLRTALLRGVDRVLSVSATTAQQLVDRLGVAPARVRVAPTGVPASFFSVTPEPAGDELRIVFIGNLSFEKDPMAALEVVALAAAEVPVRMRFLGDGPLRPQLEHAVADCGMSDRIEVLGSVPDVRPHLAWADVLLLTSQTEGLPGVPLEAGAAGVPSVVFAVGGAGETVIDGVTGRVVPAGDRRAAADALVALARDAELRRTWGEAARDMVRQHFTLEDAVQRYVDLLGDEVRRSGRSA